MSVEHKGWDWKNVQSESWNIISEEFLPIALSWCEKFESILDVGAGKGRHAMFFAKNGLKSCAVDFSKDGIDYISAKSKESNLEIDARVADMTELPFDNESFDGVICFHTIYHSDYQGVKKALSEIHRVLKPGGEAYITFNAKDNPNFIEEQSVDGYTMIPDEGMEKGIPHCYVDAKDIFEIMDGFDIISLNETINFVRRGEMTRGIHYFVHVAKTKE